MANKQEVKRRLDYVKTHYKKHTLLQMAVHLGVHRCTVVNYMQRLGVTSPRRPVRLDLHLQAEICRRGGTMPDRQLGAELGVSHSIVAYYREKFGVAGFKAHPGSGKSGVLPRGAGDADPV